MKNDGPLPVLPFGAVIKRAILAAAGNYGCFFAAFALTTGVLTAGLALWLAAVAPAFYFTAVSGQPVFLLDRLAVFILGILALAAVQMFFSTQFSTGFAVAAAAKRERGERLKCRGMVRLAAKNYGAVTKTLLSIMLCSLGLGAAMIPVGLLSVIPFIGIIALFAASLIVQAIYAFCISACVADGKKAFDAIGFAASVVFGGGFFITMGCLLLADVLLAAIFAAPVAIAATAFIGGGFEALSSGTWLLCIAISWLAMSALAPFYDIFVYYIYANARIRAANSAYAKMKLALSRESQGWEAYKAGDEKLKWEELAAGCNDYRVKEKI